MAKSTTAATVKLRKKYAQGEYDDAEGRPESAVGGLVVGWAGPQEQDLFVAVFVSASVGQMVDVVSYVRRAISSKDKGGEDNGSAGDAR